MYNKVFTKLLWHRRRKHDFGIMAFLRQLKLTTEKLDFEPSRTLVSRLTITLFEEFQYLDVPAGHRHNRYKKALV